MPAATSNQTSLVHQPSSFFPNDGHQEADGVCRPNPQYTIMVDQFVNLPFPDWYYTFLQDNAAWDTETGNTAPRTPPPTEPCLSAAVLYSASVLMTREVACMPSDMILRAAVPRTQAH